MSSAIESGLPELWEKVELGSLSEYINGYAFKPKDWSSKGLPIIRIQNLNGKNEYNFYDSEIKDKYKVFDGDILISWSASLDVYKWNGGDAVLNQHIFNTSINTDIITKGFFFYTIKYSLAEMGRNLHGMGMKHITKGKFERILVPLPPITEQKRIVAKIDSLFAKIDKAIALTEESLKLAENLLPRIIDEIFESFDCEKVLLKDVSNLIQYGYTGKTNDSGKYYYLRITDIQKGSVNYDLTPYSDIKENEVQKYKLNKGDLLFARTGATAGKSYLFEDAVDAVFASYLIRVVCDHSIVLPKFIKWFFQSSNYWKQIYGNMVGAAQPNFNGKKLGELYLKIPSLDIQKKKILFLENASKKTELKQSKLEKQLDYLKQLKSSILAKAFSGEL